MLTVGENQSGMTMLNVLKSKEEEIGFLAIFSHGTEHGTFNSHDKFTQKGFYLSDSNYSTDNNYFTSLDNLAKKIADGKITFASHSPTDLILLSEAREKTAQVSFSSRSK